MAITYVGCSKSGSGTNPSYPVLVVDEAHQQAKGLPNVPGYDIASCDGIRLDGSNFNFASLGGNATPDLVQVVIDSSHVYKLAQPTPGKTFVVDASTTTPLKGDAFPGFKPGTIVISIGHSMPADKGPDAIAISWVGKLTVRSK